jgi:hypothetical protein
MVQKPKGKGPVGRTWLRHKWEDDIKIDLKYIGCDDVNTEMNLHTMENFLTR